MNHATHTAIELRRDCKATLIPSGQELLLSEAELVVVTQALGGSFTVRTMNGQLARIDADDADALGFESPNLAGVLDSPRGRGSPLDGRALIAKKAKRLVIVDGFFPAADRHSRTSRSISRPRTPWSARPDGRHRSRGSTGRSASRPRSGRPSVRRRPLTIPCASRTKHCPPAARPPTETGTHPRCCTRSETARPPSPSWVREAPPSSTRRADCRGPTRPLALTTSTSTSSTNRPSISGSTRSSSPTDARAVRARSCGPWWSRG